MAKGLAHKTVCDDATLCDVAGADYLLVFRKDGKNEVPVSHERGLLEYYGADKPPHDLHQFRGMEGDQKLNKYSHHVWRRYASSSWHDIDISNVLPYQEARDAEDEKHVHPLQLDVIARAIELRSNPGEIVFTPETEAHLSRFIIAKPDPLVEAIREMALTDATPEDADRLRAALAARGLEVRKIGEGE